MAVLKCKMCGGDLIVREGTTVAFCDYCGSQQTVPGTDIGKKTNLFNRANQLRLVCEFDKAAEVFEKIVEEFPQEAEAYWGLVLCKYGIEYVDDPGTGKKIPTCHRSSYQSVLNDLNYAQALKNADSEAYEVYTREAKALETLRSDIVGISAKEEPYDIFICYKETDRHGDRTLDSELAQDLYELLTSKGYRVFFSRITLEDKLGREYEPYIFAALSSARIMLAVGTDVENYNAVWVKNEWSRFLKMIAVGEEKILIPCYKGINPNDMPHEFARLQAQDLGKVGATKDLLRGIEKILPSRVQASGGAGAGASVSGSTIQVTMQSQLDRAGIFLQDREWEKAYNCYETILNSNPKAAEAYFGELLCKRKCRSKEELLQQLSVDPAEIRGIIASVASEPSKLQTLCSEYVVPGYLEEAEIRKLIAKNGVYESKMAELERQMDEKLASLKADTSMVHALEFAEGDYQKELEMFLEQAGKNLRSAAVEKVAAAEKEIASRKQEAVVALLKERHAAAEAEREKDYQNVCRIAGVSEIDAGIKLFNRLGDYRDSAQRKEKLLQVQKQNTKIQEDPLYFGKWLSDEHSEELQTYLDIAGGTYSKEADVMGTSSIFWFLSLILQIAILFMAIRGRNILVIVAALLVGFIALTSWDGKKEKKVSFVIVCLCGALQAYINITAKPVLGIICLAAYVLALIFLGRKKISYTSQETSLSRFREYEVSLKKELDALWRDAFGEACTDLPSGAISGVDYLFDKEKSNGIREKSYERWLETAHYHLAQRPEAEKKEEEGSTKNVKEKEKEDQPVSQKGDQGNDGLCIYLETLGSDKVKTIKAVRRITGLELSDAKNLVDQVSQKPQMIIGNLAKDEAERIKGELEDFGNRVTIRKQ